MAAIAVLLACAGCSTQADPPAPTTGAVETPAPSADPSTEPDDDPATPAPTLPTDLPEPLADLVTEPVYPEAAREFTHDGAAAFIQYVIDAGNWVYSAGDSSHLEAVCSDESAFCAALVEHAPQFAQGGLIRFGGESRFEATAIDVFADEEMAFIAGVYSRSRYVDVDSRGDVAGESDSAEYEVRFQARFKDGDWILEGAGNV